MTGVDPRVGERGIIDQPDFGKPVEHLVSDVIRDLPLSQHTGQLGTRPRLPRQLVQQNRPSHRVRILHPIQRRVRCPLRLIRPTPLPPPPPTELPPPHRTPIPTPPLRHRTRSLLACIGDVFHRRVRAPRTTARVNNRSGRLTAPAQTTTLINRTRPLRFLSYTATLRLLSRPASRHLTRDPRTAACANRPGRLAAPAHTRLISCTGRLWSLNCTGRLWSLNYPGRLRLLTCTASRHTIRTPRTTAGANKPSRLGAPARTTTLSRRIGPLWFLRCTG